MPLLPSITHPGSGLVIANSYATSAPHVNTHEISDQYVDPGHPSASNQSNDYCAVTNSREQLHPVPSGTDISGVSSGIWDLLHPPPSMAEPRHLFSRSLDRPMTCTDCRRSFTSTSGLIDHIDDVHLRDGHDIAYFCWECKVGFQTLTLLNSHSQTTDTCGGFLSTTNHTWGCGEILGVHSDFRRHLDDSPEMKCWRSLWDAEDAVINHAYDYAHTIGLVRPTTVQPSFNYAAAAKGLLKTATNVLSTLQTTTNAETETLPTALEEKARHNRASKQRRFDCRQCEQCDRSFHRLDNLKRHERMHHTKPSPIHCPECGFESQSQALHHRHFFSCQGNSTPLG